MILSAVMVVVRCYSGEIVGLKSKEALGAPLMELLKAMKQSRFSSLISSYSLITPF